jgi:hypothetical protein
MNPGKHRANCQLLAIVTSAQAVFGAMLLGPVHSGTPRHAEYNHDGAQQPKLNACNCAEIPDLISRGHEVQAAISALKNQINDLESGERAGRHVPYTSATYDGFIRSAIKDAMDRAYEKDAHRAKDDLTFTLDCSSTIKTSEGTGCLWQSLEINEAARQRACESSRSAIGQLVGSDWRTHYSLVAFARQEIQAYREELDFINQQLTVLYAKCNFSKWTGTIAVSWKRSIETSDSFPHAGAPPTAPSGTDTSSDETTEDATITVVDGRAYGSNEISNFKRTDKNRSGNDNCHGGGLTAKVTPFSWSEHSSSEVNGHFFHGATFQVSFSGGDYKIYATLPTGSGNGTSIYHSEYNGECQSTKPVDKSAPIYNAPLGAPTTTVGKGRGLPTDLELDGTDSPDANVIALKGLKQTISVTVTWHLSRRQANR